ncbi:MAG: hypothetical protein ACJ0FR_05250 [Gammaproteobacteria bacterium]
MFNIAINNTDGYKIHHVITQDNKNFSFRNPIIYEESMDFKLDVTTIADTFLPTIWNLI